MDRDMTEDHPDVTKNITEMGGPTAAATEAAHECGPACSVHGMSALRSFNPGGASKTPEAEASPELPGTSAPQPAAPKQAAPHHCGPECAHSEPELVANAEKEARTFTEKAGRFTMNHKGKLALAGSAAVLWCAAYLATRDKGQPEQNQSASR